MRALLMPLPNMSSSGASCATPNYGRRRSFCGKICPDQTLPNVISMKYRSQLIGLDRYSCGVRNRSHAITKYLATDAKRTAVPSSERTDGRVRPNRALSASVSSSGIA